MTYRIEHKRITCGPAKQDWCDLAVQMQGVAPIHIKNWSDYSEKLPQIEPK